MGTVGPILLVFVLVAANAFFVVAEYSLVTARRARIARLAEGGSRAARTALRLKDEPTGFISTVQIAITGLGVLLGAVGEPAFSPVFGPVVGTAIAVVLSLALVTFVSVWLGELVPKALALDGAERIALLVARPIMITQRVFAPGVWALQRLTTLTLRPFGVTDPGEEKPISREELRSVLADAEDSGALVAGEEDILAGVIDLRARQVVDVMTPWDDVQTLHVDLPAREALGTMLGAPYSRFPLVDDAGTVIGVVHLRDVILALDRDPLVDVRDTARTVPIIPPDSSVADLMTAMRREGRHLAVVGNEYGQMIGIATLEDVLEEFVGEIEDEFDVGRRRIRRLEDGSLRVDAGMSLIDFGRRTGLTLESDHANTVGGLVFDALGRAARPGDEVVVAGLPIVVEAVDGARIERVRVRPEALTP
jgi:putative hemolysin